MSRALILVLAVALAVSACGRRGAPAAPPSAVPQVPVDPEYPDGETAPDRRFILDPLLD